MTARFKADGYSKLFSLGKGLALNSAGNSILNVDLGYMDSKIDPTDNFENYKRVTGSLRYTLRGEMIRSIFGNITPLLITQVLLMTVRVTLISTMAMWRNISLL